PDTSSLSLHDALPVFALRGVWSKEDGWYLWSVSRRDTEPLPVEGGRPEVVAIRFMEPCPTRTELDPAVGLTYAGGATTWHRWSRSEEHTSELQSRENL